MVVVSHSKQEDGRAKLEFTDAQGECGPEEVIINNTHIRMHVIF